MAIETVLRFSSPFGLLGLRDILLLPDGRLYLAAREPDSVYVVDTSGIVDNDRAEISDFEVLGALAMHDLTDDAGQPTEAFISTSALAWVPGQNLLLATHFRDNSVSVFDLRRGAWGEEIAYIPYVGENPSTIAVSPDGSFAAIGCYLGEVTDEATNSSIALLDLRPDSPTWLQVTTRIVNR
jgi:DNA-binding beta-propeller fold protein YncE